jgi:hypothetical protein
LEFLIGLEWTGVDWSGQIKGFRGLVGSWFLKFMSLNITR